jgi:predicted S18 family serine protease
METKASIIFLAAAAMLLSGYATAYTTQIHAPAVLANSGNGVLTIITLNLTPGTGMVNITGPDSVGKDTLNSAQTAAAYASQYLGVNESHYNFLYNIEDSNSSVSGPSGGLALTLLAVSALEHEAIYNHFTVTGTIDSSGNVGAVGGVYDKIGAARSAGMKYALVPTVSPTDPEYLTYYLTQQTFNIPLKMVANLQQALPYTNSTGATVPPEFTANFTQNYFLNGLPSANVSCSGCNASYFGELVNFTLDFTGSSAASLGTNFSSAKSNFMQNIATYRRIASSGYLYEAADLAFLQYENIYAISNAGNLDKASAQRVLDNVSAYCSSLTPPQLTSSNYEYVIGGEVRQAWSKINLAEAQSYLNASNTTDDIVFSLQSLAPSYAWCKSSAEMYRIASQIGGSPVALSQSAKAEALAAINASKGSATAPLYIQSAENLYNESQYGAALYGATYSESLGSPPPQNANASVLTTLIHANAANSTFGVWPSQFADSALFSLNQADAKGGNEIGNITSAYTTSLLALNLAKANGLLVKDFVPVTNAFNSTVSSTSNSTVSSIVNSTAYPSAAVNQAIEDIFQNQSVRIDDIDTQITQIYSLMLMFTAIMGVIAILLLLLLLKGRPKPADSQETGPRRSRGRR